MGIESNNCSPLIPETFGHLNTTTRIIIHCDSNDSNKGMITYIYIMNSIQIDHNREILWI